MYADAKQQANRDAAVVCAQLALKADQEGDIMKAVSHITLRKSSMQDQLSAPFAAVASSSTPVWDDAVGEPVAKSESAGARGRL